jgi:hypothetical protein
MSPRRAAWLLAAGRVGLGVAVLGAPEEVTARWLGPKNSSKPVVIDLARSLGARDLALGLATLQTLDDAVVGPRIQALCAVVDGVDAVATLAARRDLPASGALGTIAVAGVASVVGFYLAHKLAHS